MYNGTSNCKCVFIVSDSIRISTFAYSVVDVCALFNILICRVLSCDKISPRIKYRNTCIDFGFTAIETNYIISPPPTHDHSVYYVSPFSVIIR